MTKKSLNKKQNSKPLWHAIAKIFVGWLLMGAWALGYASPHDFALAIVAGGVVLTAQGFAEFIIEALFLIKINFNGNIMNLFNPSNNCCHNLIKGIVIKSIKEREIYKAECDFPEKIEVIVKENKNKNDKDYTKKEFNNTKLAYELCNDELSKIFENPIPKSICFDDNKLALSYIPGNSKEWPFIKDSNKKMSDCEYKCAIKYLAKLHSIPIKENNKLEKGKYGGSNPISDKFRDDNEKLDNNNLSSYKGKLNFIYKNIPISLLENNSHDNDLVYSHGDFKPFHMNYLDVHIFLLT